MKSYWISKRYMRSGVVGCIIGLIILALGLYTTFSLGEIGPEMIFTVCGLICCALCLDKILFTFQGGKYSVDGTGITMHIGRRHWTLPWNEIRECDMWSLQVGGRSNRSIWIYFSLRHLEDGEHPLMLSRRWNDLGKTAFFQYSTQDLQELLDIIPPHFAQNLRTKQEMLEEDLNRLEKVRHW